MKRIRKIKRGVNGEMSSIEKLALNKETIRELQDGQCTVNGAAPLTFPHTGCTCC